MSESTKHVYDVSLGEKSDRKGFFASSTLVTATGFFRLKDLYNSLTNSILPLLSKAGSVKVWSAGCSDGREPYSVALAIQKWIHENPQARLGHFELRASDITDEMIQIGLSNNYEVAAGEITKLKAYDNYLEYTSENKVSIGNEVKRKIKFSKEDIITHKAISKYHILICTNVLFYYEMEYRKKIVGDLIKNLRPDGYIYLESVGSRYMKSIGLERVNPGNHFFRFSDKTP